VPKKGTYEEASMLDDSNSIARGDRKQIAKMTPLLSWAMDSKADIKSQL
jgi:hypothetical protein